MLLNTIEIWCGNVGVVVIVTDGWMDVCNDLKVLGCTPGTD